MPEPSVTTDGPTRRRLAAVGFALGPVAALAVWVFPLPVVPQAHALAGLLAWVVIYWITEPIPIPATALLAPVAAVALGVGSAKDVFAPFAHPVIFLFIGSFLIAEAMIVHGLDRRIAYWVLTRPVIGESPARILFAVGLLAAGMSLWVSNTATTAMMLPIATGMLGALAGARRNAQEASPSPAAWRYSTALMLMVAYAASIGGLGTVIGTPPNLIGKGLIADRLGVDIGFVQWMQFGIPIVIVTFAALLVLLYALHPPDLGSLTGVAAFLARQRAALGAMGRGERNAAVAFGTAVILWLAPAGLVLIWGADSGVANWYDRHIPEAVVALIGAGLLFVLPVDWPTRRFTLSWEEAERIDWGTILLFGSGLALGELMFQTGLSEAIGRGAAQALGADSLWTLTAFAIALGIVLSELTSNTASATMVIPVVIAIAQGAGVSALPPALGACLGASFGFMLPISTPPNAIVYGSGLIPIQRMIRAGVLLDLVGFAVIWAGLRVLCPLLGLL
ncbi:MAG: DASS family sodium-coupled anion symporter [Nitrospirota bacterium]